MEVNKTTPFWNAALPIEERLDWLMSAMTIDEKLSCFASKVFDIERLGIPALSVGGEAAHGVEARNDQNELGEPEVTTSFTQPIGMSATWNPELIKQAGAVTGKEARVIYHRHPDRGLSRWAPTIDLERDPRWGRTEEGYGEDPFLIGEMSSAYIQGMQGDDPHYLRVASTLKHFYANNTEEGRGWKNASIDPRNKYELYLEPFRRAIEKGGAEAVMTAYNKINGIPGMLNSEVQNILKNEYGLKHAVCDGGAMELIVNFHHYYGIHAETLAAAVKAGVDAMSDNPAVVEQAAREAYELKLLTEEDINRALKNMFRTKLRLGVYDAEIKNPYDNVTEADINSKENQEVSLQVARESIVLLKNEKDFLPLKRESADSVVLIGPLGDVWYQDWYGGKSYARTTLRQGMEEILGKEIPFADGMDKVKFMCGELGIAVMPDGTLGMSKEPDVFIKEDWGEGSLTFRCVRTGKYMNTRLYPGKVDNEQIGRIAAEKEEPFDWFVMEIFHLEEQEDGTVILTNRFDYPVLAKEDGSLWSMQDGERIGATVGIDMESATAVKKSDGLSEIRFHVEIVESGVEQAIRLAEGKETVILSLGCNPMVNAKEEIDRKTIMLPPVQEKLMEEIYKVNPNIIMVLFSNYPYAIHAAQDKLPAILWSATGSQDMGTAMAETIFGMNKPAGRLNMTWYRSDEQLPDIDDYDIIKGKRTYRYFDGEVLYPFGFGLTYTDFAYSDLDVAVVDNVHLKVSFYVKNIGKETSDEVVQVYGIAPTSRVKKPLKQLVGFKRLKAVQPGESRYLEIIVPIEEFRFYDVLSHTMMVENGNYTIYVGASCEDTRLMTQIEIPGEKTGLRDMGSKISADHYDDYENITLVEGQFGFPATKPYDEEKAGSLIYRDCIIKPDSESLILHLMSVNGGKVEVLLNGQTVGNWQGDTRTYVQKPHPNMGKKMEQETIERMKTWNPVYADVKIDFMKDENIDWAKPVEVTIRMTGDVKLCYFQTK